MTFSDLPFFGARRCLGSVEEHRYLAVRGERTHLLGRRRFGPDAFQDGYSWRAELADTGEVLVHIDNPGRNSVSLREGTEEEHRTGQPRGPR